MITAIVSKKGGVGKTTTSVSLAAALARMGKRVLLIDLDPNGGASLSLGISADDPGPTTVDLLQGEVPPDAVVRASSVEGLSVIPASAALESFEMATAVSAERRSSRLSRRLYRVDRQDIVLRGRIEPLRDAFDFIFFDTPAAVGLLARNAIAAADAIVVPTAPHFLAVSAVEPVLAATEELALATGNEIRLLGIVLTMVDYRLRATRLMVDEIRQRFGTKVFAVEVRVNVSLTEAPALGKTIYQYKPYATGAKAYRLLAEEFLHLAAST